jgi:hypothetical protein
MSEKHVVAVTVLVDVAERDAGPSTVKAEHIARALVERVLKPGMVVTAWQWVRREPER